MRFTTISTVALAVALLASPLAAQQDRPEGRPGRGSRFQPAPRLDPEQAKAAWSLQAKGVAKSLGLSEDQAAKLVTEYTKAREQQRAAMRELRGQRGDRPPRQDRPGAGEGRGGAGGEAHDRPERPERPDRPGRPEAGDRPGRGERPGQGRAGGPGAQQAQREVIEAKRKKFETALASFLTGDNLKKAAGALGTFNPSWDRMVGVIAGFDLGEEKTFAALEPIQKYVVTVAKARKSGDRSSMRETMQAARRDLTGAIEKVLDEDQMTRFNRAMRGGERRGDRRDGRRGAGLAERLLQFDENMDGKISEGEMPEQMAPMFDRLDENGDGFIDKEEMENAGGRGRGPGRGGPGGGGS